MRRHCMVVHCRTTNNPDVTRISSIEFENRLVRKSHNSCPLFSAFVVILLSISLRRSAAPAACRYHSDCVAISRCITLQNKIIYLRLRTGYHFTGSLFATTKVKFVLMIHGRDGTRLYMYIMATYRIHAASAAPHTLAGYIGSGHTSHWWCWCAIDLSCH